MIEDLVILSNNLDIQSALLQFVPKGIAIKYALDEKEGKKKTTVNKAINVFKPQMLLIVLKDLKDIEEYYPIIHDVKQNNPTLKFLLITPRPERNNDQNILDCFIKLIHEDEIYPLFINQLKNVDFIYDKVNHLPHFEDVSFILDWAKNNDDSTPQLNIKIQDSYKDKYQTSSINAQNLIMFSSIKPGSGKSTIAVNYALTLAKYGYKLEGTKHQQLKVLLIEGDYQNYSVGVMLSINDNIKKNIFKAFNSIQEIRNSSDTDEEKDKKIDSALQQEVRTYESIPNLDTLTVPDLSFTLQCSELFNSENYQALLKWGSKNYDAVIIDSNSKIEKDVSIPLMKMCSTLYEILNLDFNNVLNTIRSANTLNSLGVIGKTKFILNQDMGNDYYRYFGDINSLEFTEEDLINNCGIKISARIAALPLSVMFNYLYEGIPLVLHDSDYDIFPRLQFLNLVSQNYKIDQNIIDSLTLKWNNLLNSKIKKATPKKRGRKPKKKTDETITTSSKTEENMIDESNVAVPPAKTTTRKHRYPTRKLTKKSI